MSSPAGSSPRAAAEPSLRTNTPCRKGPTRDVGETQTDQPRRDSHRRARSAGLTGSIPSGLRDPAGFHHHGDVVVVGADYPYRQIAGWARLKIALCIVTR